MNTTYDQQLEEAQERKRAAQRAATQRAYEAQAPQRAIDEAEAEIRAIQQRAAQDKYRGIVARNDAAVEQVFVLHSELLAALEAGDVRRAIAVSEQANAAWLEHRAALKQALELAVKGYFAEAQVYWYAERHQLRQAWNWGYVLVAWIVQAPDALTKRIRQGLVYALGMTGQTGGVIDGSPGYTPAAAYRKDQTSGA